jgi:hypothetical protein
VSFSAACEAGSENESLIAALNRCATQNQATCKIKQSKIKRHTK